MVRKESMIAPFEPYQVRKDGVISYGTSSFGYDMRIGSQFKVFTLNNNHQVLNPKLIHTSQYVSVDVGDKSFHIPPQSYALGYSIEHFRIPEDVVVLVIGKSTYARAGLIVNVTPGQLNCSMLLRFIWKYFQMRVLHNACSIKATVLK
jgi:dCTP deaminase